MNCIKIYTDGSCLKNPGQGGYGAILIHENEKKMFFISGYRDLTTNNQMELLAGINGLRFYFNEIQLNSSVATNSLSVEIYTDSQYVKNGVNEWIHNWKRNNWKTANRSPVKNQELWIELDELNSSIKPSWYWVKGHSTDLFNNIVDRLANKTASIQKNLHINDLDEILSHDTRRFNDYEIRLH